MFRNFLLVLALVAVALSYPLNAPMRKGANRKGCMLSCNIYQRLDTGSCKCVSLLVCDERMRKRRDYREVPANEREAFVRAVKQLNKEGIWGALAKIHGDRFEPIHSMGNFFPWHTGFLFLIETLIMDREPSIKGLPYFQWGAEPDARKSTMWQPEFMGSSAPSGGPIPDGPFKNFAVGGAPVTRNFSELPFVQTSNLSTMAAAIANREGLPFWIREKVLDVSDVLELFHSRFHFIVGGTMNTATSPEDPIFHLHHAYVDKWWVKQWPEAGGFLPTDAERMLDGIPLVGTLPNLGGLTFQNSIDIQACVEYVEPTGAASSCIVENSAPAVDTRITRAEVAVVAKFERKTIAQVKELVASIYKAIRMAPVEEPCYMSPYYYH